ncbi:MAG: HD-GYP domain-containing protein, partial [Bacillota bacterium]
AIKIGEKLGLPETELNRLKLLVMLHDIGKINIPREILTKEGSLSPEEWKLVKQHPETGYRIAHTTEEFAHVAEDILAHHERWDGTGYPNGLKKEKIPLLARITAVADAYEVMTNGRPYKEPMTKEEIVKEVKRCAGKQFDPELVEIFLSILGTEI